MATKKSFKKIWVLLGLPILAIALGLGIWLVQQETSTQSQASGTYTCYKKCEEQYSVHEDQFYRCKEACDARFAPKDKTKDPNGTDWKLKKEYRPLFCDTASTYYDADDPQNEKAEYKTWLDATMADLVEDTETNAVKLFRKLKKYEPGDMNKAYKRYCIDQVTTEEGTE